MGGREEGSRKWRGGGERRGRDGGRGGRGGREERRERRRRKGGEEGGEEGRREGGEEGGRREGGKEGGREERNFQAKLDSHAHYYLWSSWKKEWEKCTEAMVFTLPILTVSVIKVLHSGMLKGSMTQYHTFRGECMAKVR